MNPAAVLSLIAVSAQAAAACPLCHTAAGSQIRVALFGPGFWFHLAVTILPFAFFLGIVALVYFGPPSRKSLAPERA